MDWKQVGLGAAIASTLALHAAVAASPEVTAAENNVSIDFGFMHSQYHENLSPGDDESGFSPSFGAGVSVLVPTHVSYRGSVDIYSAVNYDYALGSIGYSGHYLVSGLPLKATDRAVFNRIEARIGVGFPMIGGAESIPFFAGGYQTWNRNIYTSGSSQTSEFYRSGLFGLGWKFDVPLGESFVASATGEILGLADGGITSNTPGIRISPDGFGITPEERMELELDDAVFGRVHMFAKASLEHFNYSGTRITTTTQYYEPFSTTTQFSVNVGLGYSFN